MSNQENTKLQPPPKNENETLFRVFFEQSADAYLILDGNVFVDCNQATVKMLHAQNKTEVLRTHPADLSPEFQPDGRLSDEKADEMIRIALERGSHRFEWMHRRLDGEDFPVEVLLTPIKAGDKTLIHATWRDITERKQSETVMSQLVALVEVSHDAIFTANPRGEITSWNPAAALIFGYTAEEIIGKSAITLAPPEAHDEARRTLMRLMNGEQLPPIESVRVAKDGRRIDAIIHSAVLKDAAENVTGFSITIRDISERKRAERERAILEKQIREAYERRGEQVHISTEISQEIAQATELNDLFNRVVTLTKERLGYYHTQLLRYDSTQRAVVLVAGYGETGQNMIDGGHKMPIGRGLIGIAAATGETILRADLSEDPDWQPNPLLPETRSEIAVPIKLKDEVLGVLDIQSDQVNAITDDDRLLLEGLCGQIAIAMAQTRLRQEMKARLDEINRLYRAMRREGWQEYQHAVALPAAIQYDQSGVHPIEEQDLASELFTSVELALPGGDALGELAILEDPERPLTREDQTFLKQISGQIALALENARLFNQTQEALSRTENLYNASREISASKDADEVAQVLIRRIDRTNLDRIVVTLIDQSAEEPPTAEVRAVWDKTGRLQAGERLTPDRMPLLNNTDGQNLFLIDDFETSGKIDPALRGTFQSFGVRSVAAIPIRLGESLFGWLILETLEKPRQFSTEDMTPFIALAEQAAVVLKNQQLLQQTQSALTAVQESEQQLAEAMRIAHMANWELNLETMTFTVGDRLFEMLGTTPEELGGRQITAEEYAQRFVYPEDAGVVESEIQLALQSENPENYFGHTEYRIRRLDGEIRQVVADYRIGVNDAGRPVRAFGSFLDVTERVQAEQALREAQERAQTILESITLPMVIARSSDAVITFINQPALETVQWNSDEIIGRSTHDFYHNPEDRERFIRELREKGQVSNMEMQLLRADGTPFWALLSARVFNYQGEPSILTTFSDITERIRAQEAVTRRATELATVAEIGTTISTILEEQQLLETVVQLTQRRFNLYHCHVFILNEQEQTLQARACGWEEGSPHFGKHGNVTIPLDDPHALVAQAARNRQSVIVNDVRSNPNWQPSEQLPDTNAEMAVPVIAGGQVLGVLGVQAREVNRFSDADISIMTTLASQMAVALKNARAYAQTQQQAEYEAMINQISQRIQSTTSVESALQVAIRELGRALGAKRANIQLGLPTQPKPEERPANSQHETSPLPPEHRNT